MELMTNIALVGNPNCGKTTLFNSLTGSRHQIGNYPGVTVEKKQGKIKFEDNELNIIDLPGIYSLSPYSQEEVVSRNYIIDENPEVIINIVDASNIERNLYLTTQLLELGKPVVIALNMMDIAEKRGLKINEAKLSKYLGIPVVPIVASKKKGIKQLLQTVSKLIKNKIDYKPIKIEFTKDIENKIEEIIKTIENNPNIDRYNKRWIALKVIEEDIEVMKLLGKNIHEEATTSDNISEEDDYDSIIADSRYNIITDIVAKSIVKPKGRIETTSDKVDKILTNKWLGLPIFTGLMFLLFYTTFNIGNIFLDMIDVFFAEILSGWVSTGLESVGVAEWLQSLIVDGIIGGVGGVLTFVPNIAILFLGITLLEDSGYMARVAFVMDRAMRKIGLNGKAFIPMLMGFGCNTPAIMGTRTLKNEKDRLTAILINPFMSCSARLPVYVLFASAFFKGYETIVTTSLYIMGILIAIIMGLIFKKTLFKGEVAPFIMELPPYRLPRLHDTLIHVWDRVKGYIIKAGTVIFAASVVLWFILGFNFSGAAELTDSIGASIGKIIAPIFKPLGFGNWQAALSIITGLVAKEVIVSNMAIVYGLGEAVGEAALEGDLTGFMPALKASFSQLSAYTFMVFVLLYTPCVGVIGAIKRETNSWKWTGFSILYQFTVAWLVAFLVYQIGSLIF